MKFTFMKSIYPSAIIFFLLSLSIHPHANGAVVNFSGQLDYIASNIGGAVYSGVSLGTDFSGAIDDQTFSGFISDGTTVTSFGCCIAAGGLSISNNTVLDSSEVAMINALLGSGTFNIGDEVDIINIEGDVQTLSGGRMEIGVSYLFDVNMFSDENLSNYPFDPNKLKLAVFFITEFDGQGNEIYSAVGELDTPVPKFDMKKYWPVKAGTVWIYDRDLFIMGSKTHIFNNFTGTQLIMQSSFCDPACGSHPYFYSGPEGLSIVGLKSGDQWVDLLDTPIKFASADMSINDVIITIIPAGRIDNDQITITVTLVGLETVAVPVGQFDNTLVLQIRVDDSPSTHYIEKVWLAENIGPIKIQRVSESPLNHEGCLFTCNSFDSDGTTVLQRDINLESLLGPQLVDINNDGIIGMEESIYILQVLSGIR